MLLLSIAPVQRLRKWDAILAPLSTEQRDEFDAALRDGAESIGIIGGADGPTKLFITKKEGKRDE